jgi:hypothetical protein
MNKRWSKIHPGVNNDLITISNACRDYGPCIIEYDTHYFYGSVQNFSHYHREDGPAKYGNHFTLAQVGVVIPSDYYKVVYKLLRTRL